MIKNIDFKKIEYPNGETGIEVLNFGSSIKFIYQTNQDIIDLMMIADILGDYCHQIRLDVKYFPYSRMDRIEKPGQCFSLKWFCDIVNNMGFKQIYVTDPHSPVSKDLLNNYSCMPGVFCDHLLESFKKHILVCPDLGCRIKFSTLNNSTLSEKRDIIYCEKKRDFDTGEILETIAHINDKVLVGKDLLILDDICDGGRTFIEIAKLLKPHNPRSITLAVSHGFFTKGLDVFDGFIDNVYCLDDNDKLKRVK